MSNYFSRKKVTEEDAHQMSHQDTELLHNSSESLGYNVIRILKVTG